MAGEKEVQGPNASDAAQTQLPTTAVQGLPVSERVVMVACGKDHIAALTDFCQLYTWGDDTYGALGHGEGSDTVGSRCHQPMLVKALIGETPTAIACGARHTVALCSGQLYSWGWGACGQLGLGHTKDVFLPQKLTELKGKYIVRAACGYNFTLVATLAGEVLAFGGSEMGQVCPDFRKFN